MRIFFREGIFLSFVFALVFSSAYSQGQDSRVACAGALESVGKIACDENALCYQEDDAFTCVCKDTYSGDGWAAGTGCIEGLSHDMPESGRVESHHNIQTRYVGLWVLGRNRIEPCQGFWVWMGRMICERNADCMQGFRDSTWMKCICRTGRGNGISTRFPSGTGCR